MTTAEAPRRASRRARVPTAPASFDVPCAVDEALRRNLILGFSVVLIVFGIMGMTRLWTIGVGPGADRWLASAILVALVGIGGLALLKGRVPLRVAKCDELGAAIRSALRVAPAR